MPNRQIGTSSSIEELLLSDISKQLDRLIQVAAGGGGGTGTVTSVSVVSANGFAGSVATPTTTPAITISTTVTGILKGNGTAISAAVAGTDYLAPNGSGAALTGVYLLASGGTLTGANTITGTTTNIVKYVFNTLNAVQTNGAGLWLANTTAATSGQQQWSPSLVFEGQGWKTNATAASQSVKFRQHISIASGAAAPTGIWNLDYSIDGAAYVAALTFSTATTTLTVPVLSVSSSATFNIFTASSTNTATAAIATIGGSARTGTAGTQSAVSITAGFAPTSGTGVWNPISITSTINQTGGANGQVTMCQLTPVITAAVNVTGYDWNPTTPANISGTHLAFRAVTGAVLIGVTTKSANTGTPVLILGNASTNATGAQTDGVVIHAKDASTGSANSTLAFYTEEAPEATATFTQTHRIKVWWNNVEYWLSLDAV